MDIHTRVVAILNIIFGAVGALFMLLAGLAFGGFVHFSAAPPIPGVALAFGVALVSVFVILLLAQVIAGVALLKGSQIARACIIAFAILDLFAKPWGTLLGIYTLWALLRKRQAAPTEAG